MVIVEATLNKANNNFLRRRLSNFLIVLLYLLDSPKKRDKKNIRSSFHEISKHDF